MDVIQLLDPTVANQIAAGEVVQRPASVVKELLENAVDAGAKNISLLIGDSGSALVKVIDDGKGMSSVDAQRAFLRHATSKIATSEDLFRLCTFGFRGEALASIASVANVELQTRKEDQELGTQVVINGGSRPQVSSVVCNRGTSIAVRNLFFNIPARRKFLKSATYERKLLITELERVVLVNPDISFTFASEEEGTIMVLRAASLRQRVADVVKKRVSDKLLAVEADTDIARINGWIATGDTSLANSGGANFFVNGRYMRSLSLQKAVSSAYGRLLEGGKYPQFYIFMEIDPAQIDVNIHPTKTEIKFEREQELWQLLNSTIRRSLGRDNMVPQLDFDNPAPIDIPIYRSIPSTQMRVPTTGARMNYNPFANEQEWGQKTFRDNLPDIEDTPDIENIPDDIYGSSAPREQHELGMDIVPTFQIIQCATRYLCTSTVDGLVVVDYPRAMERIEYERLMRSVGEGSAPSQLELFPTTIELSVADANLLVGNSDTLSAMGFDIGDLGEGKVTVYAMPVSISANVSAEQAVADLVEAFSEQSRGDLETARTEKIAATLAHSASRIKPRTLQQPEMLNIVSELFACQEPNFTPIGLPVLTILSNTDLEKKLRK